MESIAFKNYRCFENCGPINIKPLTFFLGANSTGKSSVLKIFPLLKQSIGRRVNGSFLWTDQDALVDLMNLQNVMTVGAKEMELEFLLKDVPFATPVPTAMKKMPTVKISMVLAELASGGDYLKRLIIEYSSYKIQINYKNLKDVTSILVNDLEFSEIPIHTRITNSLVPCLSFGQLDNLSDSLPNEYMKRWLDKFHTNPMFVNARQLYYSFYKYMTDYPTLRKQVAKILGEENTDDIKNFCNWFVLYNINEILDSINMYMMVYAKNIHYIQPLRAMAYRSYPLSNLAVDEIASNGANLPMFIYSLTKEQLKDLNKWLKAMFDITVIIKVALGRIELLLKEKNKPVRNLVDVGFGYSQILPIVVLIWKTIYMDNQKSSMMSKEIEHIIAIEQPELHLHPRFQGLFADALCSVIKYCLNLNYNIKFVIETHSEAIINRIGENISMKTIAPELANVVIFDAIKEGYDKNVYETNYDDEGFLRNWPYGFFTYYVDRNRR